MPRSRLRELTEQESEDTGSLSPQIPPARYLYPLFVLVSFLIGLLSSYLVWGRRSPQLVVENQSYSSSSVDTAQPDFAALIQQVNPAEGYKLPLRYGDLGPRLLASGAINYDAFAAIYADSGSPLTPDEVRIMKSGSEEQIVITSDNAHFLLNFFWAVGLVNKNPILTDGPMVQYSDGKIESFASTGGWTIGSKPVTELYASMDLIPLTVEQQARVEEAAAAVYRPCCNNPTLFPDCNHGMAMLGLFELMASQGASVDEMFTGAKYVNAFWFPQQALETAVYLKANRGIDFVDADARLVTGREFSSGSGFGLVHQRLQSSGLLPQTPGNGGGCSN